MDPLIIQQILSTRPTPNADNNNENNNIIINNDNKDDDDDDDDDSNNNNDHSDDNDDNNNNNNNNNTSDDDDVHNLSGDENDMDKDTNYDDKDTNDDTKLKFPQDSNISTKENFNGKSPRSKRSLRRPVPLWGLDENAPGRIGPPNHADEFTNLKKLGAEYAITRLSFKGNTRGRPHYTSRAVENNKTGVLFAIEGNMLALVGLVASAENGKINTLESMSTGSQRKEECYCVCISTGSVWCNGIKENSVDVIQTNCQVSVAIENEIPVVYIDGNQRINLSSSPIQRQHPTKYYAAVGTYHTLCEVSLPTTWKTNEESTATPVTNELTP